MDKDKELADFKVFFETVKNGKPSDISEIGWRDYMQITWQASAARSAERIAELEADVARLKDAVASNGFAVVPIVPTDAMIKAAQDHDDKMYADGNDRGATIDECWYAMLSVVMKGGSS